MEIIINRQYGKLIANPSTKIKFDNVGYYSVVGLNNSGKSSFLQFICTIKGNVFYLPVERLTFEQSRNAQIVDLNRWMPTVRAQMRGGPVSSTQFLHESGEMGTQLKNLMQAMWDELGDREMIRGQVAKDCKSLLESEPDTQGKIIQLIDQDEESLPFAQFGSGFRALLPIIMAVNLDTYPVILIDEPELSLEPRLQKKIKNYLIRKAQENNKLIIVATHSHIFLNKKIVHIVGPEEDDRGVVTQGTLKEDLPGLVFNMLGSSPSDILLPDSIIICEGSSDQVFLEKILNLKNIDNVGVHFASGLEKIPLAAEAIKQMLKPVGGYMEIYKPVICALFDRPQSDKRIFIDKVEEHIESDNDGRVVVLDNNDYTELEFCYPKDLVMRLCGSDFDIKKWLEDWKTANNRERNEVSVNAGSLGEVTKRKFAQKVSDELTKEHLEKANDGLQQIILLVEKAESVQEFWS
jgi:predicted ATP-dependent endonuclease of OLD family